ncbi:dTDP-4-amino-4,6-dideoxygalactose transaminase [Lachnospiraceae bacterium]|nr:dTDP-4-amino-4,6-dideoxygalactose transaminase [Lachnospiraceae bacterium]
MIPFNKAVYLPKAAEYVEETLKSSRIAGDGKYTRLCTEWMEQRFRANKILLTTSCTAALEMCAILLGIRPGDEVILPSYTFVSTANAFVLRGAAAVFVDIRPDTMNIDETKIEAAVTERTKAIIAVHYAGVACEMDRIMEIAGKYRLPVIEDAAQGVMSTYKGKALGTIGTFGCYSFHETKNYTMGEGGALLVNDEAYIERAEILREKGTDRTRFYRGMVDKYSWRDIGSSYLPSEINAALLYAQLEIADRINDGRRSVWNIYYEKLKGLPMDLPIVSEGCVHNAHMFFVKVKDIKRRKEIMGRLKEMGVDVVFHYVPLHSSPGGLKFGRFYGEDRYTTKESGRLIRLPMWYGLTQEDAAAAAEKLAEAVLDNENGRKRELQ